MNSKHNKLKSEFLGMPHGTATHKLRKMILFRLVKETKQDVCFRCKTKITSINELSIDHKEPWENSSVELFWDLNNIAFSHLKCNRPHNKGGVKLRKVGTVETSWCYCCETFKNKNMFFKRRARYNDLAFECKKCAKLRDKRKNHSKKYNYGEKVLTD